MPIFFFFAKKKKKIWEQETKRDLKSLDLSYVNDRKKPKKSRLQAELCGCHLAQAPVIQIFLNVMK